METVRRTIAILQEGDFGDLFAEGLAAGDAQWHPAPELESGGTYVGAAGFVEFMDAWTSDFDDWTIELTEVRDGGDRVLAFARQRAVGRGSGVSVEMDFGMLVTLRDGVITDTRAYLDRSEALAAAGLQE